MAEQASSTRPTVQPHTMKNGAGLHAQPRWQLTSVANLADRKDYGLLSFASSSLSFFSQEGCNIDTVGVSSESHIDTGLNGFFRDYLSTAGTDDNLISDTFFDAEMCIRDS